jgi:chromosome segregation ATPase
MMPEEDTTRSTQPGGMPYDASRGPEGDLLAERRALRAADGGELALTRRAEVAEASAQALRTQLADLQRRLSEAEGEREHTRELLETEREAIRESEHELRRVKQREYAEQQLRVEAEERLVGGERERRVQIDRLTRRLAASEREAAELAQALARVQCQLAETEQATAAQAAAVKRGEQELNTRLAELERRALELHHGLATERQARERSERLLETMRLGHRQMEEILGDVKQIVQRLNAVGDNPPAAQVAARSESVAAPAPPPARSPAPTFSRAAMHDVFAEVREVAGIAADSGESRGAEMADALAAAVERLRARAEAAAAVEIKPVAPSVLRVPHKHSMSLIGRLMNRRKQRRGR